MLTKMLRAEHLSYTFLTQMLTYTIFIDMVQNKNYHKIPHTIIYYMDLLIKKTLLK